MRQTIFAPQIRKIVLVSWGNPIHPTNFRCIGERGFCLYICHSCTKTFSYTKKSSPQPHLLQNIMFGGVCVNKSQNIRYLPNPGYFRMHSVPLSVCLSYVREYTNKSQKIRLPLLQTVSPSLTPEISSPQILTLKSQIQGRVSMSI